MKPATVSRIDRAIWALAYGGLFCICVGVALVRGDEVLGWGLVLFGGLLVGAGIVLLVVRSRVVEPSGLQPALVATEKESP